MRGDGVDIFLLVVAGAHGDEQIEIADRFLAAAKRACGRHGFNRFACLRDVGAELLRFVVRHIDQESPDARQMLELLGGFQDILLALFAEAGQVAQLAFARELFDAVDCGDLELFL